MCGEKAVLQFVFVVPVGSPPHVRGKEDDGSINTVLKRITPACAGKSEFDVVVKVHGWDHPRMCGEK